MAGDQLPPPACEIYMTTPRTPLQECCDRSMDLPANHKLLFSSRLFMVQNALLQQEWRLTDRHHRLVKYIQSHLAHPYKNVRDRIINLPANHKLLFSSRLFMVQNALLQQEWRVTDLHHRLVKYIQPHLAHPYKNVRDRLGR